MNNYKQLLEYKRKNKRKRTSISIREDQIENIRTIAKSEGISYSDMVEVAIDKLLEEMKFDQMKGGTQNGEKRK